METGLGANTGTGSTFGGGGGRTSGERQLRVEIGRSKRGREKGRENVPFSFTTGLFSMFFVREAKLRAASVMRKPIFRERGKENALQRV